MPKNPLLRSSEYVPLALKSAGSIRVNHNNLGCSGSSNSLLITTKMDGSITAKCFRCGANGASGGSGFVRVSPAVPVSPPYTVSIPAGSVGWSAFPMEAKAWLLKGGVGEVLCGQYGIVWSSRFKTLVIPVRNTLHSLAGVVHRGFTEDTRYRLLTKDGKNCFLDAAYYSPVSYNEIVVLTEDSLSAIRCAEAGFRGIALLGVHMRSGLKDLLAKGIGDKVVVWLDNDTSKVKLSARAIKKELSWLNVQIVSSETDAKYHSTDEIKEIVWKVLS